MSDNPFAEPEDDNRTVIRPTPGRRRSATPEQPPVAPSEPPSSQTVASRPTAAPVVAAEGTEGMAVGNDVLAVAAAPLLQLMARLRNTASPPDSGDLYERTVRQIRVFEQEARDKGVPLEQLRPAHYALCASLDDIVLNTPWGSSGSWSQRSLVSTFHQEVRSGERFFDLLKQMCANPGRFLPVIELMYICMSLGFIGQYRLSRRGVGEINRIREETYAVITRQRKAAEPALAPHTKGVNAPYRPARFVVPLWVAAAAGLGVIGALFLWFSISLNAESDTVYARLQGAPPDRMPTITRTPVVEPAPAIVVAPPPPEPSSLDKLRQFLKPEIDQKLVEVLGTPAQPLVRIIGRNMFASGSATLTPSFKPLLERIGLALKEENGPVKVIGYTDSEPIRTIAFPSNFQLSTARAQAASTIIGAALGEPSRITVEGRADADPIAPNTTPEGRERNRRIEVVLYRQGG
ncbi:type VI secretion system protein ImpK [Rhodospirillales bacterium URHD0017]|nr:type VI secretion system protein ImpK [Rhodospirillales bacterium URHD0017]